MISDISNLWSKSLFNGKGIILYIYLVYSTLASGIFVAATSPWHKVCYQCFFLQMGLSRSILAPLRPKCPRFQQDLGTEALRHCQSPQALIWIFQHLNTFENPAQTSRCSLPLGCLNRFIISRKTQQPPCNYPADSCFHYSSANVCMSEYQSGMAFVHQHRNIWPGDD